MIMKKNSRTYPMSQRHNLVKISDFAKIPEGSFSSLDFIASLPDIHAGKTIRKVISAITNAARNRKTVIIGLGAHVIKCGLSPWLIKLMRAGVVSGIALNGAGSIHDFELAFCGETSEDVAKELAAGRFGFVEETGAWMGEAFSEGAKNHHGMGKSLFEYMKKNPEKFPNRDISLLWNCGMMDIPCTVHVAIGTDFIHLHSLVTGESIGATSFRDFEIFCDQVETLEKGVYFNLGSAVILPEVFLKAVSRAHNSDKHLNGLTTVNMDMLPQYRALTNVVKRPSIGVGEGYSITGHHEIMFPLIAMAVLEGTAGTFQ
ncbi:MAG: hypothetical protein HQM10_04315 [Candidatus Riflebacteria bacterium]|nr:hypothetical protein [Candidatus Riflebacteria bacterium]